MLKRIYMDANAGAPLLPEVRAAFVAALDEVANASSVHAEGRRAREIIENIAPGNCVSRAIQSRRT